MSFNLAGVSDTGKRGAGGGEGRGVCKQTDCKQLDGPLRQEAGAPCCRREEPSELATRGLRPSQESPGPGQHPGEPTGGGGCERNGSKAEPTGERWPGGLE